MSRLGGSQKQPGKNCGTLAKNLSQRHPFSTTTSTILKSLKFALFSCSENLLKIGTGFLAENPSRAIPKFWGMTKSELNMTLLPLFLN